MTLSRTLILLTLLASQPVVAREWPETAGWGIMEGEDFCGMMLEYEGEGSTVLSIAKDLDGRATMIVSNYNWSIEDGQEYQLEYVLGETVFGGAPSIGKRSGTRRQFHTFFGQNFWPALRAAPSLRIYRGEAVVDQLSLSGSAAAVAVVDRCLEHVRSQRAAEERERQRFAHITRDPFATSQPPSTTGSGDRPPQLLPSVPYQSTSADYPATSLRNEEEGRVSVRLTIGPEGRVIGCAVTASSQFSALDTATCSMAMRRWRFAPAQNASGQPIEGTIEQTVNWRIP